MYREAYSGQRKGKAKNPEGCAHSIGKLTRSLTERALHRTNGGERDDAIS
jgi:hypothetical protein